MDGPGRFKHSNGTSVLEGNFRRNQFEKVRNFIERSENDLKSLHFVGELLC